MSRTFDLMSVVTFSTPTISRFGEGARHELPGLLSGVEGGARVLIVASATALLRPEIAALRAAATEAAAEVHVWDKVKPNPRTEDIDACCVAFGDASITHVLGIGGGSALDQGKATAMALHAGVDMATLLSNKSLITPRKNSLILVPTTSGTGAELSYGAILTNETTGEKLGLRGKNIAADVALVDPELTWSMPRGVTILTGFDVLTHALETWLSSAATPYTRDLSRGAIERVFAHLPRLFDDIDDREARREMSYASMIMGLNLALSTTCMPHRLQYPIGAATDTAHAEGLVAIYPAWLDHVEAHARSKLAQCANWLALGAGKTEAVRASLFVQAVKDLLARLGLTLHLRDLGVTAEMVERFPGEVTGRLDTDPGYSSSADIKHIYDMSFTA